MSATAVLGSTGAPKPTAARCSYNCCRKKLGLIPLVCRCGVSFCAGHLPAEEHACSFDYRGDGQKKLTAALPTCHGEKIDKI